MRTFWDWRRRIADLYGGIRAEPDPRAAWHHWRATRDAMFSSHPESPIEPDLRAGRGALPYFEYDPVWRLTAELASIDAPEVAFDAGHDGTLHMRPFAHTAGLRGVCGRELTLFWITGYGGGVFLPFADGTSGRTTYGGGRYLLDTIKGADLGFASDGRVIVDFNFAYNPSCVYSDRYVCPLTPPENRVSVPITAGEQTGSAGRTAGS